mgnify:FL=1
MHGRIYVRETKDGGSGWLCLGAFMHAKSWMYPTPCHTGRTKCFDPVSQKVFSYKRCNLSLIVQADSGSFGFATLRVR